VASLIEGVIVGKKTALARLITWAESQDDRVIRALRELYPRTGPAYRTGITGPPGAGKSTLIARIALAYRERGDRVGVVAVDPTSPFTGGALLGDRIRMTELSEDPEIFVRSMATRGSLGGLAGATAEALDLLDAAGYHRLFIETVGVGQIELDVAMAADTVVVVLVPESGDGVQAMKAGLMEIGDVFVVNKADRDGADQLARELESMLDLRRGTTAARVSWNRTHQDRAHQDRAHQDPAHQDRAHQDWAHKDRAPRTSGNVGWRPPVICTSAVVKTGHEALIEAVDAHRVYLEANGGLGEKRRATMKERILGDSRREILSRLAGQDETALESLVDRVARRELSPRDAAARLVDRVSELNS
jgi:LAO/AO transport system kinase